MSTESFIIDLQTIVAAQRGDLNAFEKIMSAFERPIFGYLLRLTGRREVAEDLTQDTFLKCYEHRRELDPEKNLKAWLFTIATNTAYDWFRRHQRRPELFIIDDPDNPFETIDPANAYYLIDQEQDVARALEQLNPVHQSVLLLFYYHDLSYEEIAHTLRIPLNTAKTHLSRAKQALKKILDNSYG